jgi:hypothetical protein
MSKNHQEPNPISQAERSQNFQLTIELANQIRNNLLQENGDKFICDMLEDCISIIESGGSVGSQGINALKKPIYNELDKITLEMTGNNWDKNHKFNQLLNIEQLFDWLKTLQCGRRIRNQRKLAGLND